MTPAYARGHRAEQMAARYLVSHGYAILASNVRLGHHEIDLVAQKEDLVAVVEVRTRGSHSYETPFGSVSARKQRNLLYAATLLWNRTLRFDTGVHRMRIDVASVVFSPSGLLVEYQEGALTGSSSL